MCTSQERWYEGILLSCVSKTAHTNLPPSVTIFSLRYFFPPFLVDNLSFFYIPFFISFLPIFSNLFRPSARKNGTTLVVQLLNFAEAHHIFTFIFSTQKIDKSWSLWSSPWKRIFSIFPSRPLKNWSKLQYHFLTPQIDTKVYQDPSKLYQLFYQVHHHCLCIPNHSSYWRKKNTSGQRIPNFSPSFPPLPISVQQITNNFHPLYYKQFTSLWS